MNNKLFKMLKKVRIKSIKKIGKMNVYDINVPEYHNFFLSNNILSHNSDTRGLIEGQEDLLCINEISRIDIKDILDKLRAEIRMPKRILLRLHMLEQDEMIIVERKQKAILVKPFQPPRCRCYKYDSFLKVWKSEINDWKNSLVDLNIITGAYEDSLNKMKQIELEKIKITAPPIIKIVPEEKEEEYVEEEILI